MIDLESTILAQYANSPNLLQLVRHMNAYLDPAANLTAFLQQVQDIETAQGYGLDVLGRIVGVGRLLKIKPPIFNLGFSDSTGCQPFGQAPFYSGPPKTEVYRMADEAYRRLILVKAMANISSSSIQAINQMLRNIFGEKGRAYAQRAGTMKMLLTFEFLLDPVDLAILLESGAVTMPTGVSFYLVSVDIPSTFGFAGSGMQPFGQGSFCNDFAYYS